MGKLCVERGEYSKDEQKCRCQECLEGMEKDDDEQDEDCDADELFWSMILEEFF